MVYKIKVHFTTGGSFDSYEEDGFIEQEWKNLDIVKQNLKRIEEHYKYYQSLHTSYRETLPRPSFVSKKYDFSFNLITDDGKEYLYSAGMYCGYFETLHSAEVVIDNGLEDLKISF